MHLVRLFVQIEAARNTVDELGKAGFIQFRDLNPNANAFQRNFVNEVRRAEDMEKKLRYFQTMIERAGIPYDENLKNTNEALPEFDNRQIEQLEVHFEELEREISQLSQNQETLERNYNELIEMSHVLEKDESFFGQSAAHAPPFGYEPEHSPLLAEAGINMSLGLLTGVIPRSKVPSFERVLWRTTRGNLFFRTAEIEDDIKDPSTGQELEKNVFVVLYQGRQAEVKIRKLCDAFQANLYPCPEAAEERANTRMQVKTRLDDLRRVLDQTRAHSLRLLNTIASQLTVWKAQVIREKSIYHTMNLFNYDVGRRCLIAEGWCPNNDKDMAFINSALDLAERRSVGIARTALQIIPSHEAPPTYYKTNEFTEQFQQLIDSYGMARYQEVNPAPFAIVTFPFLFGVMFGDIGHGFLFLLTSLAMLWIYPKIKDQKINEMLVMLFSGRYLIVLMSFFAIYCGALYNECFGLPTAIFSTNWSFGTLTNETISSSTYATRTDANYAYPFGVDYYWKVSANELFFYNSLKMKMSVIMGIIQMLFGLVLSLLNQIYFMKPLNFVFEWIPQVVFMLSIFGYMDLLIVYKWLTNWAGQNPPQLLNLMIAMILYPWQNAPEYQMYGGQHIVQVILLALAFISVPLMLLPKPFILRYLHNKKMRAQSHGTSLLEEDGKESVSSVSSGGHGEHGEEFDFSEVFIHQIIHTIEYVLGCISNTASYLRLWALSLAHAQLSEVFWERVMVFMFQQGGFFAVFIGWSVWAGLTVGILLLMESLSAFLHALRLHWVEFQNKFYMGDGYKFTPFSYSTVFTEYAPA